MFTNEDARRTLEKIKECEPYKKEGEPIKCNISSGEAAVFERLQERGAIKTISKIIAYPSVMVETIPSKFKEICKEYNATIKTFPNRKYDKDMWNALSKIKDWASHMEKGESIIKCEVSKPSDEAIVFERLCEQGIITKMLFKTDERWGQSHPEANVIKYTYSFEIDRKKFDKLYKSYADNINKKPNKEIKFQAPANAETSQVTSNLSSPEIDYNKDTGVGHAKGKHFKFKNNQPEYFVFADMYLRINHPIPRKRVLELCKYETKKEGLSEMLSGNSKRKSSYSTSGTYLINNLAKKMRKRTGLDKDQIVNNNGDLTLVGSKKPKM